MNKHANIEVLLLLLLRILDFEAIFVRKRRPLFYAKPQHKGHKGHKGHKDCEVDCGASHLKILATLSAIGQMTTA
jgi:hypothetical protein